MFSYVDEIRQIQTSISTRSYSTPFPKTQSDAMERIGTSDGDEKCQTFAMCDERRNVGTKTSDRQMDQGEEELAIQAMMFSFYNPLRPSKTP